jgi:NADPH2:quinone reductase
MKAMLCTRYGVPEDMTLGELPTPTAGDGQVVIAVKACGVNFPDVLMLQDRYQFRPSLPFPLGGEVAGVVEAVGPGVTAFRPGDRVCASIGHGGFAEQVVIDAARCIAIPDGVGFDVASAFIVTYGTSYYALKERAGLRPGEWLVVLGAAGGVGLAAVELGRLLGAKVVAGASTQEKVDLAVRHGASTGFVYPLTPLDRDQQKALSARIKELTGGAGADVLYDPVGDDYAEPALRAMNWGGRYLVIGFAAGQIPRVPLNLTLLKGSSIVGVFWGASTVYEPRAARASLVELLGWIAEGKIAPHVSARLPLAQAQEAVRLLWDRRAQGKVVVTVP